MEYDIKTINKWIAPKEDGVTLLTMPNIPLPMHTSAPRTIDPKSWEKIRKQCYAHANYTCQATGVEMGKGHLHAHELYDIDWDKCTMTFQRAVALDPTIHTRFIHSGRALTMFQQGNKYFPKIALLSTLEYGFSLISSYNNEHPDAEPLRVSDTFLEWEKHPELKSEVNRLIKKFNIKFYTFDKRCFNKENWGKWKLIWNDTEYPTKFPTRDDWENHFELVEKPVENSSQSQPKELEELDKMIKETDNEKDL